MTASGETDELVVPPDRHSGRMGNVAARVGALTPRTWLALFTQLAFLRSPHVLLNGRFWAEEGSIHFAHAHTEGGFAGLTFVDQRAGYLNLLPNVGTWLATFMPLSAAPLVTTWLSFLVLVLVLWVALALPSDLLPTPASRLVAAGLLLFGPAAHPEVWLNTINAQTYFGIVAILVLFVRLDELSPARFAVTTITLVVAALSGLYTVILTPLFVGRAYLIRTRRTIAHAVALGGATAFQGIVVLVSRSSGSLEESKLTVPGLEELVATVGGLHLSTMLLGRQESAELAANVIDGNGAWVLTVVVASALVVAVVGLAVRRASVWILGPLVAAFVLTEILVQLGAWGIADARYAVVPLAIVSLLVAHGIGRSDDALGRGVALGVAAVALVAGLAEYWIDGRLALACLDCPDWQAEVEEWEADPTAELEIWPYPPWPFSPWTVDLSGD